MALGTMTVLDGTGAPITIQVLTVPNVTWAHVIVDGASGNNVAGVTAGGALKIDGTATVQPVSGTVGITGPVTIGGGSSMSIVYGGNTAQVTAAGALKIDGSGVTQPVSVTGSATVSGTVTANIGTAGPLALETGGNLASLVAAYVAQGTALGSTKQLMVGGSVTTLTPSYTAGQIMPLSLNTFGQLRVDTTGTSVKIWDGTNTAAVKGDTAPPTIHDPALVVSISPNSQNPNGPALAATSSPVTCAIDQYRGYKGITETTITSSTAETTIVAAVAGRHQDIYGLILANSGTSATKVTIKDSSLGTTRMVLEVPAGDTRGFMLPVDSAVPQLAAVNNNWTATCGTATSSLDVTAMWVTNL